MGGEIAGRGADRGNVTHVRILTAFEGVSSSLD
jgi:hypothetical protein